MFKIAVRTDPPISFRNAGKYDELIDAVIALKPGEYVVLDGFENEEELARTQGNIGGSNATTRRKLRAAGCKVVTRRYVKDGKMELWMIREYLETA